MDKNPGRELLGQMAIRRGFITKPQLETALRKQKQLAASGRPHRLIGLILVEMGLIGTDQLIALLQEAQHNAHQHARPREADGTKN